MLSTFQFSIFHTETYDEPAGQVNCFFVIIFLLAVLIDIIKNPLSVSFNSLLNFTLTL